MYRSDHERERQVAAHLATLFQARTIWSIDELAASGVPVPARTLKRRVVVAYLATLGWLVDIFEHGRRFVARRLHPFASHPAAPGALEAKGKCYFYFPPETEEILSLLEDREPIWLVGPTGSGKSTLLRMLIERLYPGTIYEICLHGETTYDDFIGTKELLAGATRFRRGPLYQAMVHRRPFLIEEIDIASPEVTFSLQPVAAKGAVCIPMDSGEDGEPIVLDPWVPRDGDRGCFVLCATGNTFGRGDASGTYRGTQALNEAFLNRWTAIWIDYPPPPEEAKVLLSAHPGIGDRMAGHIAKVAELARSALKAQKLATPVSVRGTLRWARFQERYGMKSSAAFRRAILDGAYAEDRAPLAELFQRVFGSSAA